MQDAANDHDVSVVSQGSRTHKNMATTANAVSATSSSLDSFKPNLVPRHAPGDFDVRFDVKFCGICEYSLYRQCAEAPNIATLPQPKKIVVAFLVLSGFLILYCRCCCCTRELAPSTHISTTKHDKNARPVVAALHLSEPGAGTAGRQCRAVCCLPSHATQRQHSTTTFIVLLYFLYITKQKLKTTNDVIFPCT